MKLLYALSFFAIAFTACKRDVLPKPDAYLRLSYPRAHYKKCSTNSIAHAFEFDKNTISNLKVGENGAILLEYPKMKATLYLSYKSVNGNLNALLKDAQKLTYDHVVKADGIIEQPFANTTDNVYGMFYEVGGNAATNAQFYVTDSTQHFLVGAVYFYAKPNFDSIYPATEYIKNDMRKIMESVRWK